MSWFIPKEYLTLFEGSDINSLQTKDRMIEVVRFVVLLELLARMAELVDALG